MQQVLRYGITGAFLLYCAWQDIRTGRISYISLLFFGTAGVFLDVVSMPLPEAGCFCIRSGLVGILLLLFSAVTHQQFGYGDGLVLLVTGFYLPWAENAGIFLTGLFLCGLSVIGRAFAGKIRRGMKLPFVPYLAAGYMLNLLCFL